MTRAPIRFAFVVVLTMGFGGCDHAPAMPTSASRSAAVTAAPAAAGPAITALGVSGVGEHTAKIAWSTDQPADSVLELSVDPSMMDARRLASDDQQLQHELSVTDLLSATTYYFRVTANNEQHQSSRSNVRNFHTLAATGAPLSGLDTAEFFVIEFKYPGSTTWSYAPQLTVRETSGRSTATVTKLVVVLPGLNPGTNPMPPFDTSKCVAPGQTLSLLNEIYGDFELTFDRPGSRASGTASIVTTFADPDGREGTTSATGPIVPGSLPTTYSGGSVRWPCASGR